MKKVLLSCAEVADVLNSKKNPSLWVTSKNLQEMLRRRGFEHSGTSGKTYLYKPTDFLEVFKLTSNPSYYSATEKLSNYLIDNMMKPDQLDMDFKESEMVPETKIEVSTKISLEGQIRNAFNKGDVRLVSGLIFNEKIYTIFHSSRGFDDVELGPVLDIEHWNTSNCPEEYDHAEEILKTAIKVFSGQEIEFKEK